MDPKNKESLFRGQKVESRKWVFGFYYEYLNKHYIMTRKGAAVLVDKKTVTQYIGRLDKEGGKVFMGDVLEYHFKTKTRMRDNKPNKTIKSPGFKRIEIGFKNGCFCSRTIAQENCYYGELPGQWESLFCVYLDEFFVKIGDIFDIPELLTEKSKWNAETASAEKDGKD